MAGDWIKWTKGLAKKKEVLGVASRMGITPHDAAGLCMIFWEWLDDNVSAPQIDGDGNAHVTLGPLQPDFIDSLVCASGFAAALTAEGWLHTRSGSLVVPNYCRHNGQTAKDRALAAERASRHRLKKAGKSNAQTVTTVTEEALPEKRREEKKVKRTRAGHFVPPTIEEVQAYCRERCNGVDPSRWINHYTSNGWMVGRTKMKDWKAAVRTWEGNDFDGKSLPPKEPLKYRN